MASTVDLPTPLLPIVIRFPPFLEALKTGQFHRWLFVTRGNAQGATGFGSLADRGRLRIHLCQTLTLPGRQNLPPCFLPHLWP